jgi:hypothetical protein
MNILTYTEPIQDSRYIAECSDEAIFSMNGNPMHRGYYNLVVSIRDVKLFVAGMKAHRSWRLKDVKDYFGVKGNKENVLKQLIRLREEYIELGKIGIEEMKGIKKEYHEEE